MKNSRFLLLAFLFFAVMFSYAQHRGITKPNQYVNPFIGTGGHGHTYPGATVPFGMVQLSPDNGTQGWDWSSGYNYSDTVIAGFSHTHLSGTGIGDLCDISVMPTIGIKPDTVSVKSGFSHAKEQASPGFYSVFLNRYGINAAFTTTKHCGLHQYTFPAGADATIRFDLGFAINWDWATQCSFKQLNDTTFVGYRYSSGWAQDQRVYFAIRLSKPIKKLVLFKNKQQFEANNATAKYVKAHLVFNTQQGEKIMMKVALSMANEAGAIAGLQEIKGWNFNAVKNKAAAQWEKELGKITIKSKDTAFKTIFYTSLYHTYLAPTIFNDYLGNYKGADGKIHQSVKDIYSVQSLWDTFRAANPLLTLTQPERVANIINSYLAFYKQKGLLPVWDLHFNETNTMTGYHAVPIIADAILKNIKGFDINLAYKAMVASAMQNVRGTNYYRQYGYLPLDKSGESVTITLEYAFDDWCIAQVAKQLGKTKDYTYFMQRSASYKQLFDEQTGFFRAKTSDRKWATPFNPFTSDYPNASPYTEGNAWQHNWFVPQNVPAHIALMGGKQKYLAKLDSLFTVPAIRTANTPSDVTGLIGQYAHGNEPSHHIAYLYNLAGQPKKTADKTRQIMETLYTDKPDGLCGNEDCGQMSAWYVFSALGFYPLNPANGQYVFGSPLIDKATIKLPNHKFFSIIVKNNSIKNNYIASITLNGKIYTKNYLAHSVIQKGGVLVVNMKKKIPAKTNNKK